MPFDLKTHRDKYPSLYGDASLRDVAKDLYNFNPSFQKKYASVEDWGEKEGLTQQWDTDQANTDQIRKHRDIQRQQQSNLEDMNFATRAVARGANQTHAMLAGAAGLAGDLFGSDAVKDWGIKEYKRNLEDASLYPGTEFEQVKEAPTLMKPFLFGQFALEKVAEQVPNIGLAMATGGIGGVLGGTSRVVGNKIVQNALGGMLAGSVRKQVAGKGILKALSKKQILNQAQKQALQQADRRVIQNIAAKTGVVASTAALESGGMYGEGDEAGYHNPVSALGLGILAGMVEIMGGNIRVIDKVLGKKAGNSFSKALDRIFKAKGEPGDVGMVSRMWREALRQAPAEAGQEAIQESLALANHVVMNNDPGFELLSMENLERIGGSAAVGGLVGIFFGGGTGALNLGESESDYDGSNGLDPDTNRDYLDHVRADDKRKDKKDSIEFKDLTDEGLKEDEKPVDTEAERKAEAKRIAQKKQKGEELTPDEEKFIDDLTTKVRFEDLSDEEVYKKAKEIQARIENGGKLTKDDYKYLKRGIEIEQEGGFKPETPVTPEPVTPKPDKSDTKSDKPVKPVKSGTLEKSDKSDIESDKPVKPVKSGTLEKSDKSDIESDKSAPTKERKRVFHYTAPENVEKILKEGYDTSKPPIHGVGGLEGGAKTKKAGGEDILYFTTDKGRWSSAEVYVGEGKGDITRNAFDYEEQKWKKEENAYKRVDLKSVEADVKRSSKTLEIDSYQKAADFFGGNIPDIYSFIKDLTTKAKKDGFDVVNIKDPGGQAWNRPDGRTTKNGDADWYYDLTGNSGKDDYFVLNKKALEFVQPEKKAGKDEKVTPESETVPGGKAPEKKEEKPKEKGSESVDADKAKEKEKKKSGEPKELTQEQKDFVPHDGWETNLIKARVYAGALGIDFTGLKTEAIVALIKRKLGGKSAEPGEGAAKPEIIGTNPAGNEIALDKNGNRTVTENGIKASAPVPVAPDGGFTPLTPKQLYERKATEYLTQSEIDGFEGDAGIKRPKLANISGLDLKNIEVTYRERLLGDSPDKDTEVTQAADVAVKEIDDRVDSHYKIAACLGVRIG